MTTDRCHRHRIRHGIRHCHHANLSWHLNFTSFFCSETSSKTSIFSRKRKKSKKSGAWLENWFRRRPSMEAVKEKGSKWPLAEWILLTVLLIVEKPHTHCWTVKTFFIRRPFEIASGVWCWYRDFGFEREKSCAGKIFFTFALFFSHSSKSISDSIHFVVFLLFQSFVVRCTSALETRDALRVDGIYRINGNTGIVNCFIIYQSHLSGLRFINKRPFDKVMSC